MKQSKNSHYIQGEALRYINDALHTTCEHRNIRRNAIMQLFCQSNSVTAQRWLDGKDIYLSNLVKIVNHFNLDLLNFFEYKGHCFRTTLEELARVESAGVDVGALTINSSIKLPSECPTLEESVDANFKALVATQKELIEAQKEIIANLRAENERLKEEIRQRPVRYVPVADDSHIETPDPIR